MSVKRGLLLVIILIFLNTSFISAVRISPALVDGAFKPGLNISLTYTVTTPSNKNIEVSANGKLAEYISFSKTKIKGQGSFEVFINIPEDLELEPGPHRTYIAAREEVDKELASAFKLQTVVQALIVFRVPYPGKYIETRLSANDVNAGDPVVFTLDLIGRGDEDVIMHPRIDVYSENDELIDTLYFKERELKSLEKVKLQKELDTVGHLSGDYYAVAVTEYGGKKPAEARTDFRLGELSIDILNYTKEIIIDGIKPFEIEIESGWNDLIDGAYADVTFYDPVSLQTISNFRTSPTDLDPWGKNVIYGFFNSSVFIPGTYEADINVIYYGRDRGESTSERVEVMFVAKKETIDWKFWGVIIGAFIIILIVVFLATLKDEKRKKRK
jgi:hypothetical protein